MHLYEIEIFFSRCTDKKPCLLHCIHAIWLRSSFVCSVSEKISERSLGSQCLSVAETTIPETCAVLKYFLITLALHFPDRSVNNTWCSTLFSPSRSLTGLSPLRRACLSGLYACGSWLLLLLDELKCLCQSSAWIRWTLKKIPPRYKNEE